MIYFSRNDIPTYLTFLGWGVLFGMSSIQGLVGTCATPGQARFRLGPAVGKQKVRLLARGFHQHT